MADSFDPYYKWLGISPQEQPPNHYRLLGINLFESDLDVIDAAADRQMAHLRGYQTGQHSAASQKLLNECSAARIALLNPDKKVEYDRQLRERLASHPLPRGEGTNPLPRAKPLPQTQPAAEAAPLIDVGGPPSTGRSVARRRKARPAWQLPAAGAAAVVLLALVGWMASRPASKPQTATTQNVVRTPTRESTSSRPSPEAATNTATMSPASPAPTREAPPAVAPAAQRDRWQPFDLGDNEIVDDFVRVTRGRISTRESYTGPIEINVVARPITNSIRLRAFQGGVIWNWEENPSELRVGRPDQRIAAAAVTPLAANTWYRLRQRITAKETEVFVDDKLVFHGIDGPYVGEPNPVSMETYEGGSAFDVKSLTVTPLSGGDPESSSPLAGNQLDIALAPGVTMTLVKIPASADGKIKSFYLGQTEVTQKQWMAVMGGNPSHHQGDDLPVTQINHEDCAAFFTKANERLHCNLRLPTKEEWQRAYETDLGELAALSLTVDDVAWRKTNSNDMPHACGSKKHGRLDLYDMAGNVYELTDDPSNIYGGSWVIDIAPSAQCAIQAFPPGDRHLSVGVRVAADLDAVKKLVQSAERSRSDTGPSTKEIVLTPGVTMKLVKIPASDDGKIKSFYLGQTEVTQKQWVTVMGSNPASRPGDDLPIPQIDAPSCIEFCKKMSAANAPCQFRLPTEVEWAYAYGSAQQYADDYTGTTWCELNSGGQTQPVGKLKPNQFGLYDMLGNVRERVGDGTIVLGNDYLTAKFDGKFDRQDIGAISYLFNSGFRVAADLREPSTPAMPNKGALAGNASVPSEAKSPRPDQPRSLVLGNEPRLAAPEGEALKKAKQDLQKRISAEVAAAKSAEAKRKLAEEFLHKARTSEKRDANVYATYDEAIELAETAGDLDLAWRAIDDLAGAFAIDAVERRQQSLTQVIKSAKSPAACHILTTDACHLLADALAAHDAALVKKAAAQAQSLSKRAKDTALAKAVTAYTRDAAKLAATIEAVAKARETLKTTPDDAAANFTVGYYEFCVAGDFEHGLPKLAKAADASWRKPAADDLDASRNEVTPQRQLAVADGWWSRAADESWPDRHYLRLRAAIWFRRALTSLTGGERTRATDRVKEFLADDDGLPKWEMFDIDRGDRQAGFLRLNPGGAMQSCVKYDGPMEVSFIARTDSLNIRLLVHGHEVIWNWEVNPRELVVNRPDGTEIKSPFVPLNANHWYTFRYRIERQGTLITVDGLPVFTERHDYGKFPLAPVGVRAREPAVIDVKKLVIRPLE